MPTGTPPWAGVGMSAIPTPMTQQHRTNAQQSPQPATQHPDAYAPLNGSSPAGNDYSMMQPNMAAGSSMTKAGPSMAAAL